ncbi:MAG: hypothetical protein RLZZ15_176 [Verrucomicrobiota bacterium]|jgi:P4 family phage/plasmid primase-like protien
MSDTFSESTPTARPRHLQELYALLGGRPVLLPIPPSFDHKPQKGPRYDAWAKVTWEDTQSRAAVVTYSRETPGTRERAVFRRENLMGLLDDPRNNLGVLLGAASQRVEEGSTWHLCSIDVDEEAGVAEFTGANPRLAETLQTVGSRGRNFWVWVEGEYPPLSKVFHAERDEAGEAYLHKADKKRAWGEWRATGGQTVIYGTHPGTGRPYRREVEAPPVRVKFSEIVWPEGLFLPWAPEPAAEAEKEMDALTKAHGVPYEKTDKGGITVNQTWFAAWFCQKHKVIYSPEGQEFFQYEGPATGLWIKQTADSVRRELAADIKELSDANQEPKLIMMRTAQLENAITSKIRGFAERWRVWERPRSVKTNRPRALAHLRHCMLDLDCDPPQELPFSPDFMSRNRIDVELQPGAECPRFLGELLGNALHADDIRLLRKIAGQMLLGVNLAQKIVILTGLEGRGKSTFVKVMQRVIGEVNCGELRTAHLAERFEIFRMMAKSLVVGNDVPGDFMMQDGAYVMKSLVGGDLMAAEPKNGNESYSLRGELNILITCNTRLRVRLDGDAGAWRRRLILIPYDSPPPKKKDPFFVEGLVAKEAPGILHWMIEGVVDLLGDLENFGDIQMTAAQKDRVESLLAESDSVRDFARRGCQKAGPDSKVTSEQMSSAYIDYCMRLNWKPWSSKAVESMLPDALMEIHGAIKSNDIKLYPGDKAKRGYRGVSLVGAGGGDEPEGAAVPIGAAAGAVDEEGGAF